VPTLSREEGTQVECVKSANPTSHPSPCARIHASEYSACASSGPATALPALAEARAAAAAAPYSRSARRFERLGVAAHKFVPFEAAKLKQQNPGYHISGFKG